MKYFLFEAGKRALSGRVALSVLVVMIIMLAGCSRITQENYAKIKVGMEYAEVVAVLGAPASCSSVMSATNCTWGDEKRSIDISLVGDKVVFLTSRGL